MWRSAALAQVRKDKGEGNVEVFGRALAEHAERGGHPLTLARMSIGVYLWARHISDGVLVGAPWLPKAQGIIAGSAFATTELRIVLTESLDRIVEDNPTASLVVHVDDISVSASGGSPLTIRSRAQQAYNQLVELVQGQLGLPFSAVKATI